MFRRFPKSLVAVVLVLAFVGILRLFRTASNVPETLYVEHTYKTVHAGHQFSDKRPPFFNQVTVQHILVPTKDENYHKERSPEGLQAARPSTQQLSLQYVYPRRERGLSHYSSESNDLDKANDLLHEQQSSEKAPALHAYRPQSDLVTNVRHTNNEIGSVDTGQVMAQDVHFSRNQNGSAQMGGLAPTLLKQQTEKMTFQEILRQGVANRGRQRRNRVQSSNALWNQHIHGSVWDDKYASDLGFWDVFNKSYVDQHAARPWIDSYQCKDVICSEFLFERDWVRVGKCVNKISMKYAELIHKVTSTLRPACHFLNGTSRGGVVLLSFPGSGNTWLRGLLEKATGICTGSVYCDDSIWLAGSVGEGIKSSNVLVVKSHNHDRYWAKQSINDSDWNEAAILIIRNPFDAIVSFYKWSLFHNGYFLTGNNSHVNQISPYMFGNHPLWKEYVVEKKNHWSDIIRRVVLENKSGRPVLVVQYEDIKRNRTMEVMRILDFLGVSYSPQEVKQRLLEDVTTFQRSKQAVNIDPYTPEQRELIRELLRRITATLQHENDGDMLGIEEYLDPD